MPIFPGGTEFEQKVVTVANVDATINLEIETQAQVGWIASQFILNGSNMTIVFTRTIVQT